MSERDAHPLPPRQTASPLPRVLLEGAAIAQRLEGMGREITGFYRGKPLTVVAVMNGSLLFAADLLRKIALPLKFETLAVASYHDGTESSGTVTFLQERVPVLEGRHLLLLDDILETGRTLRAVAGRLAAEACPASIRTAVLLRKQKARLAGLKADWTGFEIGDEFVVGYGLDYAGEYRNLPDIGILG